MTLPEHTQALLASGSWRLPGADDEPCGGSRFHSPTPLFTHYTRLIPPEWNDHISAQHSSTGVWLCGVCRDNLIVLQQIWLAHEGDVPLEIRREFGNTIRALVRQAWGTYQESKEVAA